MAEQRIWYERQYPDAEYRKRATTLTDVLEEELGFYPDGPSFRGGLIAIGRMYEQTKLMQNFIHFAKLAVIASVSHGEGVDPGTIAPNFLAGETLAIHAILKPRDMFERRFYLRQNIIGSMNQNSGEEVFEAALEHLADHRAGGWEHVFDRQVALHQELLVEATIRAFDDQPNARTAETDFLAGYLYAGNLIAHL